MPVKEVQQELIEDFEFFEDWADKYAYIISMGKQLPAYPEDKKDDVHFIKGCQSQVWMDIQLSEGKLAIVGTSDAAIVSGLIAILIKIYQHATPEEVMSTELIFIKQVGLEKHLSPTRSNGLYAMLNNIYAFARKHAG